MIDRDAEVDRAVDEHRACAYTPPLASLAPLDALLARLARPDAPTAPERYDVGALTPDGRLDLCKQGLGSRGALAVADALRGNPFVSSVLMGADHLGPEGALALASIAREAPAVDTLYLGCNAVGESGAKAIADAVADTPRVRALWIKRNALGPAGARHLAAMLRDRARVEVLDVVSNDLGPEGVTAVCDAVGEGSALTTLFLCGNGAGVEGARSAASLLRRHAALRSLLFAGNEVGDEGAAAIADALRAAPGLRRLGLSSSAIGARGASALADALRHHPGLATLELGLLRATAVLGVSRNAVGDEGAVAIAHALRENRSLRWLDLRGAGVGHEGASALYEAALDHPTLSALLVEGLTPAQRASLVPTFARNRNRATRDADDAAFDAHTRAVRSVFRTPHAASAPRPVAQWPSEDEVARAVNVLRAVAEASSTGAPAPASVLALRSLCERVVEKSRDGGHALRLHERAARRARDLEAARGAGIRRLRREAAATPPEQPPAVDFERERRCYVCKRPFRERDVFYDAMCAPCAALNRARREQSADLTGRVALVTGGRVKIGFRVALKLLRAGATVVVTTRFANDAWRRFGQEPDFNTWRSRLEVHPLDLRFLLDAERFAASLASRLPRLDVLISNAALTVARPAEWHAEMARLDAEASRALPSGVAPCAAVSTSDGLLGLSLPGEVQGLDRYAQPDDRREKNSWRAVVGEVSTRELVSVHAVTALAPFVLVNALRPLLARDVTVDKFVVLVSAVEGQFYRAMKTPRHPHTNMAKAALNMLARTSGEDLARERIWCCAVDTGWVSDQNPAPIAARMADGGFEPPLDEEDGAARVLDPVFRALREEAPAQGVFLKDYAVAPW